MTAPRWPLHSLMPGARPPEKFYIGPAGDVWIVMTPAEEDAFETRWRFVCDTFEQAIGTMDAWLRHRTGPIKIEPALLHEMITTGRVKL